MVGESSQANAGRRRLRLGMVGGGQGAFIGAVHRLAARMDYRYELVAGAFSSTKVALPPLFPRKASSFPATCLAWTELHLLWES